MTETETAPEWMRDLAESIKASQASLPAAMLADAMRQRGEYPADPDLWRLRLRQLDGFLFGAGEPLMTTRQGSPIDARDNIPKG
jgi:hypothetical protein